ncbi:hypothetical protein TrRE_jg1835 [Triparma retinervis]|uniref:AMP-dependent synthetase/ligase domain-containing protein n=1 Tax=Triparma retinervis TaxID=2557542 RepID=A0A9W6ZNU2_9STRA|nr:hypothetical protein TrRE_jg1835 [Triparma retinervis]
MTPSGPHFYLPSRSPTHATIKIVLKSLNHAINEPSSSSPLILLNPRWSANEILYAIRSICPNDDISSVVLYHEGSASVPSEIPFLKSLRELATSTYDAPSAIHLPSPVIVLFTSGTTGKPKGVKLSLRSVLFQSFAKTRPPTSYDSDTALYLNIPLCHVGGLISMLGVGNSYSSHIEVGIFSPTGSPLPDGEVGVIGTRGPHVMDGYVGCPPQQPSEFLMTNDLGYFHVPSSTFCFVGRANDTVRSGGETVVCAEVEREVMRCALGLRECASFGLEDPNTARGEVVCVAVVPSAGKLRLSDFEGVLKSRWGLASYKRPRRFYQLKELPRNSNGKVLKAALRLKFGGRSRL